MVLKLAYRIENDEVIIEKQEGAKEASAQIYASTEYALARAVEKALKAPEGKDESMTVVFESDNERVQGSCYRTVNGNWVACLEGMNPFDALERIAMQGDWSDQLASYAKQKYDVATSSTSSIDARANKRLEALQAVYMFHDPLLSNHLQEKKQNYQENFGGFKEFLRNF